jgi:hypothetical protein
MCKAGRTIKLPKNVVETSIFIESLFNNIGAESNKSLIVAMPMNEIRRPPERTFGQATC